MGPQRIRQVARLLGRITGQLQRISREFARQLNAELDAVDSGEMKGALKDVRSLQEEVEALRRELSQVPKSLRRQGEAVTSVGKQAVQEGEAAMRGRETPGQDQRPSERAQEAEADQDPAEIDDKIALPKLLDVPEDPE